MRQLFLAAWLILAGKATLAADPPPLHLSTSVGVTEVAVDVRDPLGNLPPDLRPEDFRVTEDGVEQTILDVRYLSATRDTTAASAPAPSPDAGRAIAILFDTSLSSTRTIRSAAAALIPVVPQLLQGGPIQLTILKPAPSVEVVFSSDAKALISRLKVLAEDGVGRDVVGQTRHQFLEQLDESASIETLVKNGGSDSSLDAKVRASVTEEHEHTRALLLGLESWLGRQTMGRKGVVLLVSDGFDSDPAPFYLTSYKDEGKRGTMAAELRAFNLEPRVDQLSKALAQSGWSMVSLLGLPTVSAFDVSLSGTSKARDAKQRANSSPTALLASAGNAPLITIGDATGGDVVRDFHADALTKPIANRVVVSYKSPPRADLKPHRLKVEARTKNLTVRAPSWVSGASLEAISEGRAWTILANKLSRDGDLPVSGKCEVSPSDPGKGSLLINVGFDPIEALRAQLKSTTVRITMLPDTASPGGGTPVHVERPFDIAGHPGLQFDSTMKLSPGCRGVAVVVEELTTGTWGGAYLATAMPSSSEIDSLMVSDARTEQKIQSVLDGHLLPNALNVSCETTSLSTTTAGAKWSGGITVDLTALADLPSPSSLLITAWLDAGDGSSTVQRRREVIDPTEPLYSTGLSIDVPRGTKRIVVLVEIAEVEAWGGCVPKVALP